MEHALTLSKASRALSGQYSAKLSYFKPKLILKTSQKYKYEIYTTVDENEDKDAEFCWNFMGPSITKEVLYINF